jgi:pyridoxal phosphate enzyme (YggS family)
MTLAAVRDRIAAACERAGRDPSGVRLVAVTKEVTVEQARQVVAAGCSELGENRAQQLAERAGLVGGVTWHFIGPLQTNKVRYLDDVALIHSLESAHQAEALDRRGHRIGRAFDVLIEVNLAGEASKHGVAPEDIDALLAALGAFPHVQPRGFMFMAPQVENPEDVRWVFTEGAKLKQLYGLEELSMGMTDDFEVAIEEGATIVRIGRAIFAS